MGDILDPASRLEKLIAAQEPQFAAGFQIIVAQIKKSLDLKDLADLLEAGRLEQALTEAIRRAPAMGTLYTESFVTAAKDTAKFLGRNLDTIVMDFDQTNPFSLQMARENQLRLVREFSAAQREATREALVEGVRTGANPIQQARNFKDSIGLTRRQVRAVNNYRRLLEEGSSEALTRQLRDRRFDRTVRRAVNGGRPLTSREIDKMVDRYRERSIQHRSRVIARTESLKSVHEGSESMYRQAIEAGTLDPENMTKEWNTAKDERVRGSHAAMHNQKVGFNEVFTSGEGNTTERPGGFGIAEEDIQCRCAVGTRITQVTAPAGLSIQVL